MKVSSSLLGLDLYCLSVCMSVYLLIHSPFLSLPLFLSPLSHLIFAPFSFHVLYLFIFYRLSQDKTGPAFPLSSDMPLNNDYSARFYMRITCSDGTYVQSIHFNNWIIMTLNLVCILIFIYALITKISFFPDVNKKKSNSNIITYLFVSIFIDLFNHLFI